MLLLPLNEIRPEAAYCLQFDITSKIQFIAEGLNQFITLTWRQPLNTQRTASRFSISTFRPRPYPTIPRAQSSVEIRCADRKSADSNRVAGTSLRKPGSPESTANTRWTNGHLANLTDEPIVRAPPIDATEADLGGPRPAIRFGGIQVLLFVMLLLLLLHRRNLTRTRNQCNLRFIKRGVSAAKGGGGIMALPPCFGVSRDAGN